MVILTKKFSIESTEVQERVLWELAETCRLLYNRALAERKFLYTSYKYPITYKDQQNALPNLKKRFPRYKQVHSKVLQMTLRKVDAAYKSFFGLVKSGETNVRLPRFRGKDYFFTLCYNQSGFSIKKKSIRFSHKYPEAVELIFSTPFDINSMQVKQIKQVEVFQDRYDSHFYIAVTYEQKTPPYIDNGYYQAFDLGIIKHTAVNSSAKFLETTVKRPDMYWQQHIQSLQQRKDHCLRNSRRHRLFSQRLRSIQRKCANQTKDWQHKQSKKLLQNTKANTLIVGDLSVKKMASNKKNGQKHKYQRSLHRGVHNTGHLGRFVKLLTYKAKIVGKRVIVIDERATSKTCAFCGHKKVQIPLSERIYHCETCGIVFDRDKNSAINIMKRFLSLNALCTGYQQFIISVDNLRQTVNDKTKVSRFPVITGSAIS